MGLKSPPYGDSLCLDQWLVEPDSSYIGSYLDNIVTGSMYSKNDPGLFANPFAADVRKVQTSVVRGQAGTTGSLQRFIRTSDNNSIFYDSTVPKVQEIVKKLDMFTADSFGMDLVVLSTTDKSYQIGGLGLNALSGSHRYAKSGMYEHVSDLKRQTSLSSVFQGTDHDPTALDALWLITTGSLPIYPYRSSYWDDAVGENAQLVTARITIGGESNPFTDATYQPASDLCGKDWLLKFFCGIGDFNGFPYDPSAPVSHRDPGGGSNTYTDSSLTFIENRKALLLRGWKYGLYNAIPTAPTAVFRPDTFGQFRDMLEPRLQTRFFEKGKLGESSVEVSFRTRSGEIGVNPEETNSQNLSVFATSSVPYFDGNFRERLTAQPDLSDLVDISI